MGSYSDDLQAEPADRGAGCSWGVASSEDSSPHAEVLGAVSAATPATSQTESARHRSSGRVVTSVRSLFSFSSLAMDDSDLGNISNPERTRSSSRPFDKAGYCVSQRLFVYKMLNAPFFDAGIGFVIVLNSIIIGVDQTFRLQNRSTEVLDLLEHFFLATYSIELGMRFFVWGRGCLEDSWVQFDCVLVGMGVTTTYILTPALGNVQGLGVIQVLRTVRMLRLARTVRLLVKFKVLWMLVRGLLNSVGTMIYTMVLFTIMVYVFSSIGIELVRYHILYVGPNPDPEFVELVDVFFSSVPVAMLTLVQFVCLDSIGAIYKPLIEKDMRSGSCMLLIYFISIILIVGIVLMNLVTAIIVNGAIEGAMQDKEAQKVHEAQSKKKMVKKLRAMFLRLDTDESGELSLLELLSVQDEDKSDLCELTSYACVNELFEAIDFDRRGKVTIDEFCHGVYQAAVSKVPIEAQRMERQIDDLRRDVRQVMAHGRTLQDLAEEVKATTNHMVAQVVQQALEAKEVARRALERSEASAPAPPPATFPTDEGEQILMELQRMRTEGLRLAVNFPQEEAQKGPSNGWAPRTPRLSGIALQAPPRPQEQEADPWPRNEDAFCRQLAVANEHLLRLANEALLQVEQTELFFVNSAVSTFSGSPSKIRSRVLRTKGSSGDLVSNASSKARELPDGTESSCSGAVTFRDALHLEVEGLRRRATALEASLFRDVTKAATNVDGPPGTPRPHLKMQPPDLPEAPSRGGPQASPRGASGGAGVGGAGCGPQACPHGTSGRKAPPQCLPRRPAAVRDAL